MSTKSSLVLFILTTLGILLGISGCVAFSLYGNVAASVWAFMSVLFAAVNLQLHYIYLRGSLDQWHCVDTLEGLKLFGFFILTICLGTLGWYIFYIIYDDLSVLPVEESMIIPAVWVFVTATWGGCLYISSTQYINILNDASRPLLFNR